MAKKQLSLTHLTNAILVSNAYVEQGILIIISNNTERTLFSEIAFFELVYQGEDLCLNISKGKDQFAYTEKINLSTVNNINGVPINNDN